MNTIIARKVLLVSVIALFVATIFLSIGASTKGAELIVLEREIRELEEQNAKLTEALITQTSLTELTEEQGDLGLVTAETVVYLTQTTVAQAR